MLDSSLHYIVVRRYSERLAERAGKMMNRQLCNFGEHFQSDIFPADANLCIRICDWRMRVQGPRDSWADPLRVAGVRACRIAVVSEVGRPWENTSHSSYKLGE
jgi:hypothetical protein